MKLLRYTLLWFILLAAPFTYGQINHGRYEAKIGYGYYQGFNLGINYFYKENLNLGVGVGTHFKLPPLETPNHFNVFIENNLYFGGKNILDIKTWIFNQQLMYWEQGPGSDRWRIISLGFNIGVTFAITKKLGIVLEMGPAFNWVIDIDRDPLENETGWMWPILYNGRAQIAYIF